MTKNLSNHSNHPQSSVTLFDIRKIQFQTISTEIETLGDCSTDIEELVLTADDDVTIPYLVGEIFVLECPDKVQTMIMDRRYKFSRCNMYEIPTTVQHNYI